MRGWWVDFCERNNICHWNNGIKWGRYGKNVKVYGIGVEYHFGIKAKRLMLGLDVENGGEHLVMFKIGVPFLFNCYFHLDAAPNRFTKWFAGTDCCLGGRETGFSISKDFLSFSLHRTTNGWSSDKNCGYGGTYTWGDIFLGDHNADDVGVEYTTHVGNVGPSKGKPEGQKDVVFDVEIKKLRSRYSRWYMFWYRKDYVRIAMKPRAEIIVPGKGENSYDCEDEKMGEISFGWDTKTVDEALVAYNQSLHRYMTR
ncbi:hypothetical protein pEaSNUABM37_00036 [Erwinia phage pEa_SNUABM_37]|nr:hypothetical protein pEaSNUABM37_00036 [Erwinia phage pEa_SNUABM_37]QXO10506.1 hypothetical protein pEaSNUABM48_00036 [Erwinia phage pEa_SNUABM_48]